MLRLLLLLSLLFVCCAGYAQITPAINADSIKNVHHIDSLRQVQRKDSIRNVQRKDSLLNAHRRDSTMLHQHDYSFKIYVTDKDSAFARKYISYTTFFGDTFSAHREAIKILEDLYNMGYLFADIDNFKVSQAHVIAYITAGNKMQWVRLKTSKADPIILERVGFREKTYDGKVYSYKQIAALDESIIEYCENSGYPFASVKLDSIRIKGDSISARLAISKNKLIYIDSIHIIGDVKISKAYLYNYFDIKPGSPYDESKIRAIAQKLKEMQFLAEQKPYTVIFNDSRATINLFLKNKTASTLNALIGFAPNTGTSSGLNSATSGLEITGQGDLYLCNILGHGESLKIDFNAIPGGTSQFQSEVTYPYIFSVPIGIDLGLNLFKQDSSYLNVNEIVGVEYLLTGSNYIKAFYKNQSSTALTLDTADIISTHELPPILNVSTGYYGLEVLFQNLNYKYNPTRGYSVDISVAVGERKIREDQRILQLHEPDSVSFNFASLYDTVKLTSINYNLSWQLYKYFPIRRRSVIKTGISGAAIISPGVEIYTNQLFEIGGINTLRGFDENSIYSSQYGVYTLEYRYILGQNSYFSLFNDDAYIINQSEGIDTRNFMVGIGTGLAFETKAGVFNISYALGKSNGTTFQFQSAKIQFGYVNYF